MLEKITVSTQTRCQLVDITNEIKKCVNKQKIKEGVLHIFCPHTTAAVTVNENYDPSVQSDISETLSKLIPHHAHYAHTEGNADAHIKAAVMGSSRTLFIHNGEIAFGSWQGIYLCEFDGPRTREVWVKISKDSGR
jgi:secondary thiamine-phosphate synthase enzyme